MMLQFASFGIVISFNPQWDTLGFASEDKLCELELERYNWLPQRFQAGKELEITSQTPHGRGPSYHFACELSFLSLSPWDSDQAMMAWSYFSTSCWTPYWGTLGCTERYSKGSAGSMGARG